MKRTLLYLLLACLPSFAATRQTGPAQTYATISACLAAATSGDICNVHADTYSEQVTMKAGVRIQNNGTDVVTIQSSSSPVIEAASNASIVSDASGHILVNYTGSGAAPVVLNHTHGSNLDSFTSTNVVYTLTGGTGSGFVAVIADCDLCNLTGNTFHVSAAGGSHDGIEALFNSHLTFANNTIYGEACSAGTTLEDGLVTTGTNLTITGNTLHDGCSFDNHPDGIVIQGDGNRSGAATDTVLIARNMVTDFTQGIYIDAIHAAMTGILIENNVISETSAYRYNAVANKMNCLVIDGESLSGPHWAITAGVYNNTFDCKQLHMYSLRLVSGTSITIRNNVSLATPFTGFYMDDNTGVTMDYDYFSGADATPIHWGPTNNYSRAAFMSGGFGESNSAAGTANLNTDYSVKSISDVRNRGVNLTSIFTNDFLSLPRPNGATWDIGAYQFQTNNPTTITGKSSVTGATVIQ